jgi:hypothetical protein
MRLFGERKRLWNRLGLEFGKDMKTSSLRLLFSAVVLLVGYSAEAAASAPDSAFALADAMQVVEGSRLAVEARTQAGIEKGRNSQKELECWKATDFTPVREVFAEAFARVLTSAEIDEARAFLVTPLGSKFVQYMNAEAMKARGWASAPGPSLTEDENEAALKFLSTSAGSKIFSADFQSAELQKQMIDSLLPIFQKCMEPKSAERHLKELDASMTPEERARAASSAADTARPTQADAVKLVRAMREDEFFLANLRQRMNTATRPASTVQRACIEALKPTDISSDMAVAVQEQLSAAEVKDAIEYYESDAGRKFTEIAFDNLERPIELADFMKVMSVEEVLSLRKFFVLSASRKLMQDRIIQQPASLERISLRVRALTESCLRENAGKR